MVSRTTEHIYSPIRQTNSARLCSLRASVCSTASKSLQSNSSCPRFIKHSPPPRPRLLLHTHTHTHGDGSAPEGVGAHAHTSRVTATSRFIALLPVSPMIDARGRIQQQNGELANSAPLSSGLGLGHLRLVPNTNFRPNCEGHVKNYLPQK